MQLRRRSKQNEKCLHYRASTDIEVGGNKKYEKKQRLKLKNYGSFYRWQRFIIIGTNSLTVCIMVFAVLFFAADIVAFVCTTGKRSIEVKQVFVDYKTTYSPARKDAPIRIIPFNGMIRSVLVPLSMEHIELANITNYNANEVWNYIPDETWNLKPDFGGLIIAPLKDGERRNIEELDEEEIEYYYDYGGSPVDNPNCRTPSWYNTFKPNCNNIHEVNLGGLGKYLASGHFRDAFSVLNDTVVLKVAALEQPYTDELMEMMRIDATIMSLMKNKKNIVDLHGHCGVSLIVDFIKGQNIDELFVEEERKDLDNLPVPLSPTEKLNMALEMAEALSELHGFKGGVIVHGDIQYCQYLLDKDDHIILSDFNRAEALEWDDENQQYCKFRTGRVAGNVRSPEEYAQEELNEKIDVYSFGNVLFTLLTGEEPYADLMYYPDELKNMVISGKLPEVSVTLRGNSFAEAALASIMDKCFEFEPDDRLEIFEVVSLLRDAAQLNDRLDSIKVSDVSNYYSYEEVEDDVEYYAEESSDSSDSSDYNYDYDYDE